MSKVRRYIQEAESLRENPGQWAAYQSQGHCVVLAGPGSGKTKTLTIKLARILAEDVDEPRGVACITYNNECARELEQRLDNLGVEAGERVFIGTVHSFSLTQILLPYAKVAGLDLPDNFRVASQSEQRAALERAYDRVITRGENPHTAWRLRMDRYRRSHLDRDSEAFRDRDPDCARLIVAYERELRRHGLIDFDDMPLLSVRAFQANDWLQRAIMAKYPVLFVDEYQDLGIALHRMVMGLCFSTGIRLFAVGDADQSIYGFTGANPELLRRVSERPDVETVHLRLNYRCGSNIVTASQYALGEDREYEVPEGAMAGTIYFHSLHGQYEVQARHLFEILIPDILERNPDISLGDVAVLYPAAWIGNAIAQAAEEFEYKFIRADGNAIYPRSSRLMRWLEQCAIWCCDGWKSGTPKFSKLMAECTRIFAEALASEEDKLELQRDVITFLWARRDPNISLHLWLSQFAEHILGELLSETRTLSDEEQILDSFIARTSAGNECEGFTLGRFSGLGDGHDCLNLSTLHSSKGREFQIVLMFGMDAGRIPRNGATAHQLREARRLFYVGFTRAKNEVHIVSSAHNESPFATELEQRIAE